MARKEKFRDEVAAFKRARIVDEATRLFYAHGYQGTTLDDIAAAMGVTKPFIYDRFDNKTDLLYEVCEVGINRTLEVTDRVLASDLPPDQRLDRLVRELVRVVIDEQPHIAVYFREETYLTPRQSDAIHRKREDFDRKLAGIIRDGVRAQVFDVEDPELASLAIGGMVSWIFTWHRPHGRLGDEELAARMAEFSLRLLRGR